MEEACVAAGVVAAEVEAAVVVPAAAVEEPSAMVEDSAAEVAEVAASEEEPAAEEDPLLLPAREQISSVRFWVRVASAVEQAARTQGAAEAWMVAMAVPHWQE